MSGTGEGKRENPLFVGSLGKGMAVLQAFQAPTRYMSLADLCGATGMDRSTVQRMTHTLHELGYLEKCPDTRRYALSHAMLDFAYQYVRTHPLIELATPYLLELRRACDERVDLSLFDRHTLIYAVRLQSKREKFYTTLVGRRMPVFCTAGGRAMLSRLDPDEARDIVETSDRTPLLPATVCDVEGVMARVAEARERGYAVAVEEAVAGELNVGAAVVDADGRPVGAVHIAGATSQWRAEDFVRRVVPELLDTVGALNQRVRR